MSISVKISGSNPPGSSIGSIFSETLNPVITEEEKFPLPHISDDVKAAGRNAKIGVGEANNSALGS